MKPIASLSLDLDNKWSYLKTHGDQGWQTFPSYLNVLVPRVLDFLQARSTKITFFVVGQDAALDRNRDVLSEITRAGHEVGNHSFHHEPWMRLHTEEQVESELAAAEEHIERATGPRPIGFRGPGFTLSHAILSVLGRRGYLYDCSTFPTFVGPLARAYYFMHARLSAEELEKRDALFGSLRDGLRPLRPYRWQTGGSELIELPVTTMPVSRMPIHVSYLLYLGGFSPAVAMAYFRTALGLCRLTGTSPSLLLHPLDFLGCEDDGDLSFFPAMKDPREKKLALVGQALDLFAKEFRVTTMQEHAREAGLEGLRVVGSASQFAPAA
jgi:hypothetical protein